jgi:hypothetical protein
MINRRRGAAGVACPETRPVAGEMAASACLRAIACLLAFALLACIPVFMLETTPQCVDLISPRLDEQQGSTLVPWQLSGWQETTHTRLEAPRQQDILQQTDNNGVPQLAVNRNRGQNRRDTKQSGMAWQFKIWRTNSLDSSCKATTTDEYWRSCTICIAVPISNGVGPRVVLAQTASHPHLSQTQVVQLTPVNSTLLRQHENSNRPAIDASGTSALGLALRALAHAYVASIVVVTGEAVHARLHGHTVRLIGRPLQGWKPDTQFAYNRSRVLHLTAAACLVSRTAAYLGYSDLNCLVALAGACYLYDASTGCNGHGYQMHLEHCHCANDTSDD